MSITARSNWHCRPDNPVETERLAVVLQRVAAPVVVLQRVVAPAAGWGLGTVEAEGHHRKPAGLG